MTYKRRSPQPIVEGGTNASTMTTTDGVVYFDGTSLVTTAVGTATHVLTSNGAGMAPTFQPSGGGGSGAFQLIQTQTATAQATLTFTTGIAAPLNNYFIQAYNMTSTTATGSIFIVQLSTNGGVSYINTGYANSTINTDGLPISSITNTGTSFNSSSLYLYNLTSNSGYITCLSLDNACDAVGPIANSQILNGFYGTAGIIVDAIQITMSDGSNFSGIFSLYSITQ